MLRFMMTAVAVAALCGCAGTPPEKNERVYTPPPWAPVPPPPAVVAEVPVSPAMLDIAPTTPPAAPESPPQPKPPAPPVVAKAAAPAPVAKPAAVVEKRPPSPAPVVVADAATFKGHIDLVVGPDQTVGAGEVADAVVYFVPASGAAKPKPGQFQIYTRDKRFDPSSIVVPVGSTVSFPNQDEILHNVFSASVGEEFDLGVYGEGASASHTFKKAGLFVINCNVHQTMQTSVLVLDTPYFAHPSKSGDFSLDGVPSGAGKFVIWHPRAASVERAVTVPSASTAWTITITKPRVAGHLNKERKTYRADVTQKP